MKIELDERGLRIDLAWKTLKSVTRVLVPLATALIGLVSAPEIARLGALLGWW